MACPDPAKGRLLDFSSFPLHNFRRNRPCLFQMYGYTALPTFGNAPCMLHQRPPYRLFLAWPQEAGSGARWRLWFNALNAGMDYLNSGLHSAPFYGCSGGWQVYQNHYADLVVPRRFQPQAVLTTTKLIFSMTCYCCPGVVLWGTLPILHIALICQEKAWMEMEGGFATCR
ncbi:MAG: hypothetical protein Q9P14_19305, partial [candidate division KSB1 bacterium]|nr:hypothetical protein [candidate division KSB1 bacterium]